MPPMIAASCPMNGLAPSRSISTHDPYLIPSVIAAGARVPTEGWGPRLLAYEEEDGQLAGGAFIPRDFEAREWHQVGQPWTATSFSLSQLREFGLDPSSAPARHAVRLIGASSR